jgi:DNA-binding SARP family transcriptional activator
MGSKVMSENDSPPRAGQAGGATPPPRPVLIRVLGPVELEVDCSPVPVGSRMGRLLLATLTVAANHMVSSDQLGMVLWGDTPPPSRDITLHSHLSRLRHLLGAGRITGGDHSYQLNLSVDEVDALRFETLLEQALAARNQPSRCVQMCKRALHLWRGTPFGEFADRDPFRLEAIRLSELRLVTMETRFESELALGNDEVVAGALEAMVEEYPYRERLWNLYIAALALSGRRVEALRACNRLRSILSEVGLEPSGAIRDLETAIYSEAPQIRARLRALIRSEPETSEADVEWEL